MSKEVMIGMLKVANNGNDLLQILDALTDNEGDNITGDAVDFVGDNLNISLLICIIKFFFKLLKKSI